MAELWIASAGPLTFSSSNLNLDSGSLLHLGLFLFMAWDHLCYQSSADSLTLIFSFSYRQLGLTPFVLGLHSDLSGIQLVVVDV